MTIILDGKDRNTLIRHVKKGKEIKATLACVKMDGELRFGWSKYNKKLETKAGTPLTKKRGIEIAVGRAVKGIPIPMYEGGEYSKRGGETAKTPDIVIAQGMKFIERAQRYFKVEVSNIMTVR